MLLRLFKIMLCLLGHRATAARDLENPTGSMHGERVGQQPLRGLRLRATILRSVVRAHAQ